MSKLTDLMDRVTQGVYLIGVQKGDSYNFMTAAWVTQVSYNPCRIALCVASSHYTAELIDKAGMFTVSILADDQTDLAKACGYESGRKVDKAARVPFTTGPRKLPAVTGAAAVLDCKVDQRIDLGDHQLFIAEVIDGVNSDKKTLLYDGKVYFG